MNSCAGRVGSPGDEMCGKLPRGPVRGHNPRPERGGLVVRKRALCNTVWPGGVPVTPLECVWLGVTRERRDTERMTEGTL